MASVLVASKLLIPKIMQSQTDNPNINYTFTILLLNVGWFEV